MSKQYCLCHGLCWLLCVCLTGCRSETKTVSLSEMATARVAAADGAPAAAPAVDVFEVPAATAESSQPIPALLAVEGTAAVLAKRDGVILELNGQAGARIKQGEVLARFDDDDSRLQLRQTELEVIRLQFEERQFEAAIKVNRSELVRQQALARDGLTSQTEIERAQFKVEVSQQELEKTRLATRMAQTRAEAAKFEADKSVIRAPLTGIVTQRLARLGSSVVRNDKLFEVAQLGPLEVHFQLAQSDAWQPRLGELLQLSLAGEQRVAANARLQRLAPVADAASNARAYVARLLSDSNLIPGTAVDVRRPRTGASISWWIPRAAFSASAELQRGASAVLLLVENSKCVARTVWLGAQVNDQIEIRAGLAPGDRIILMPPAGLKPGVNVTMNNS